MHDPETGRHWVVDGCHTITAAKLTDATQVRAIVTSGDYLQAFEAAARANQAHGVRVTNADKRHRVAEALKHPEIGGKSNREIAKVCGVSYQMVNERRAEVTTVVNSSGDGPAKVVGKDGKSYPATKPKKEPPPKPAATKPDPPPRPSSEPPKAPPRSDPEPDIDDEPEHDEDGLDDEPTPAPIPMNRASSPVPAFEPVENTLFDILESWPAVARPMFAIRLYGAYVRICDSVGVEPMEARHGA